MWCGSSGTHIERPAATARIGPGVRVGDRDRQCTAGLLSDAAATGLLTLDELDARLARVWRATTGADLAVLEADLPATLRKQRDRREAAVQARDLARAGLGHHLAAYAAVMALLVGIWLVAGLSGGGWYPWPVWPALGWGIGVVGHVHAARAPAA